MPDPGIAVVGAGAVGCLLTAALTGNGRLVHWVERNEQRRSQLSNPLVTVGDDMLSFNADQIRLYSDISDLPSGVDCIVVAVKSFQVDSVIRSLPPCDLPILVVANGLMHGAFNLGLLYGGGTVHPDGQVELMADNRLFLGPLLTSSPLPRATIDSLSADWLTVSTEPDIRVRMYHKLALNCVINPLTAIHDVPNGELPLAELAPLMTALLSELDGVARATLGNLWQYNMEGLLSDCHDLIRRTAQNSSSMREDLRHGRRTEIAALNLAVSELAAGLGLDSPCNRYMGNMICLLTNSRAL